MLRLATIVAAALVSAGFPATAEADCNGPINHACFCGSADVVETVTQSVDADFAVLQIVQVFGADAGEAGGQVTVTRLDWDGPGARGLMVDAQTGVARRFPIVADEQVRCSDFDGAYDVPLADVPGLVGRPECFGVEYRQLTVPCNDTPGLFGCGCAAGGGGAFAFLAALLALGSARARDRRAFREK